MSLAACCAPSTRRFKLARMSCAWDPSGISPANVRHLCEVSGMEIIEFSSEQINQGAKDRYLVVKMPIKPSDLDIVLSVKEEKQRPFITPAQLINYLITLDEQEAKGYENERREEMRSLSITDPNRAAGITITRPPTDISRASKFVYADTDGSNLKLFLQNK